jgi:predicted O-methyltransferase YrrM
MSPKKPQKAKSTWQEAGENVADVIELREGDLRETLRVDLPSIDLVLLDSRSISWSVLILVWAPLALPALQAVEPNLRVGAVIICDNSISSSARYADLQTYMRNPKNGYTNLTVPYHNGLEMSVYVGREDRP